MLLMMSDPHLLSILTLGFLLGVKHALDADHIAAMSTIATEHPALRRSCVIGVCWGLGHTLVLFLAGMAVLLFKLTIPDTWARVFEAGAGMMLIALGLSVAVTLWKERLHIHAHAHDDGEDHLHLHSHRRGTQHAHLHRFRLEYKSLAIGMVHGLAGSAAVLLLVLSTVSSLWHGLLYILVFGIGSILGMGILAAALSVPFALTARSMAGTHQAIKALAGLLSVALGTDLLLETFGRQD